MTDVMTGIKEKDELLFSEVRKLKLGYSTDFNQVYELSKNYIYKIIWDIVKNRDAVDDVMQETYLQIYNKIDTLKEVASFYIWAGRIATNFSLAYLRKENKYVLAGVDEDGEANEFIFDRVSDDHEVMIPETVLVNKEQQKIISDILDGLSTEQKICVQYYYFEEMSVKEIADQMETSEGTVKSRLNYARKAIKSAVEKFEKAQGTRLYSLGAFPILMFIYRGAIRDYIAGVVAGSVATGAVATASTAATVGTATATVNTAGVTAGVSKSVGAGAATSTTASTAAAAVGTTAGVKAIAVIAAVGVLGGGGFVAAQKYEEKQQIEQAQTVYSNIFSLYENMSGSSDIETAEHLLNLSADEARIYKLVNDSFDLFESCKSVCKGIYTDEQYQVLEKYYFSTFDSSVDQEVVMAELLVDMNNYYGYYPAMNNYIALTENLISETYNLISVTQDLYDEPALKSIMGQLSAYDLENFINYGTLPETVNYQNITQDEWNNLNNKLNEFGNEYMIWYQAEVNYENCYYSSEFQNILEDYENKYLNDNEFLRTQLQATGQY